jgi:hypothetical protein
MAGARAGPKRSEAERRPGVGRQPFMPRKALVAPRAALRFAHQAANEGGVPTPLHLNGGTPSSDPEWASHRPRFGSCKSRPLKVGTHLGQNLWTAACRRSIHLGSNDIKGDATHLLIEPAQAPDLPLRAADELPHMGAPLSKPPT